MDLPCGVVFDFLEEVAARNPPAQIESVSRVFGDAVAAAFLQRSVNRLSCPAIERDQGDDAEVSPEDVIRLVLPFCDESCAPDAMEKIAAGLWNLYRGRQSDIDETFRVLDGAVKNCLQKSMASDKSNRPDFESFARLTALRHLVVSICAFERIQAICLKPPGNESGPLFI